MRTSPLFVCVILLIGLNASPFVAAQETDPRRPAAIQTKEVPLVPEAIFRQLAQYQNVRGAGFADWAPDGRGILIRTRFADSIQLHRVYDPGGRREQITFFDEPVRGRFVPKDNSGSLLVTLSQGGNENYQIYRVDRTKFTTTLLTDGKSRNGLGPVSEDGRRMIVSNNRRNGRDIDLYVADAQAPNQQKMIFETSGQRWFAADWSRDETKLLIGRYVSINESYMALLDLKTGKRTDLPLPGEKKAAVGGLEFSPDAKSVYLTSDVRGEFHELARLDLVSRKFTWLTDDIRWDVNAVLVDDTTGLVVFTVNEDGASRLYAIEDGKRRRIETPLGIISSINFSADGKHLGMTLSRPDAPSDAYSLELASGKLTRWTYSEVGGLDTSKFVAPARMKYKSFDGRQIPAYYFKPPGATKDKPAAVLIRIHGGPESQYRPYFSSSTQYYVGQMGLAVIAPNVRGSAGYGKTYLKLDNGVLRENSVRDIGALLDWIEKQPELDASRVAVSGGSYGGYMVLASLTHFPERIKAGIDVVGIANFISFLEKTAAYRRDLRRAEYGDERDPKIRKFFERINPTANAEKIRSALLVAHGVNDPRVPFYEAQQIADKVRSQGRAVWTVYAENEGHGFGKKTNRDYLSGVQVMFLKKHLDLE
jgi:dipeptidyl aminopeptidase/acylaminoacyl peptidase